MEKTERYHAHATVSGEPSAVYEWWIGPKASNFSYELWQSLAVSGDWEEQRTETGYRLAWSGIDHKQTNITYSLSSSWDTAKLLVETIACEQLAYRDLRTTVAEGRSVYRFQPGPFPDETVVTTETTMRLTGDWRRRDFLPGSVGQRRALHRSGFYRAIALYRDTLYPV